MTARGRKKDQVQRKEGGGGPGAGHKSEGTAEEPRRRERKRRRGQRGRRGRSGKRGRGGKGVSRKRDRDTAEEANRGNSEDGGAIKDQE